MDAVARRPGGRPGRGRARRRVCRHRAAGRGICTPPADGAAGVAAAAADARLRRCAPPPDAELRQGAGLRRAVGDLPSHLGAAGRQPGCACAVSQRQAGGAGSVARRLHHGVRRGRAQRCRVAGHRAGRGGDRHPLRVGSDLPRRGSARRRRPLSGAAHAAAASRAGGGHSRSGGRCAAARHLAPGGRGRRGVPGACQRTPGLGRAFAGGARAAPAAASAGGRCAGPAGTAGALYDAHARRDAAAA